MHELDPDDDAAATERSAPGHPGVHSGGDPDATATEWVVEPPVVEPPEEEEADQHTALPPKVEAWRRRSATGAILTGFALGLQQVFEPRRDEPGVVIETSGVPPGDLPVEADLEYGRPRQSVVNIRPWLLTSAPPASEPSAGELSAAAPPAGDPSAGEPAAGHQPTNGSSPGADDAQDGRD